MEKIISPNYAYFTLLTDDKFLPGIIALHKTLISTKTTILLYIVISPTISPNVRNRLKSLLGASCIIEGIHIENPCKGHDTSWTNSEYIKLNLW